MTRRRYKTVYRHRLLPEFRRHWDWRKYVGLLGFVHLLFNIVYGLLIISLVIAFYAVIAFISVKEGLYDIRRPEVTMNSYRFCIIGIDYNGGDRTDRLFDKIKADNPKNTVFLVDNASEPGKASKHVTHWMPTNSYAGGGCIDMVTTAYGMGYDFALMVQSDIVIQNQLKLEDFISVLHVAELGNDHPVAIHAAVTPDTTQALSFPWMLGNPETSVRVPSVDILCGLFDLEFLHNKVRWPKHRNGWGHDRALAIEAHNRNRPILMMPSNMACIYHHMPFARSDAWDKMVEMRTAYFKRYGDNRIVTEFWPIVSRMGWPIFNELEREVFHDLYKGAAV